MNRGLEKVKEWCDTNKVSINISKTNFMLVKSTGKKDASLDIKIQSKDGSYYSLERK